MNLTAITPEEKKNESNVNENVWKLHILTADRTFHVLDIIAVTGATLAARSVQAFISLLIKAALKTAMIRQKNHELITLKVVV